MLTTLLETFEARKTPTCVLAIVNLLVSCVGGELVKVKQLENIVTAFLKGDLKQDSWWNDVVIFLHYVCHNHILDSNLEKKVINKLEENHPYTDQCRQSDDTKEISKMYAIFDRSINA
ncbi:uncharacterized protein LOC106168241 [Lingula anatina]|uniref:Uncharacterized protein LOC106168241 n=1 Tax=Lingula anatina TaxID=7574 RepID=A0A1S3IWX4_LINAN|nr:uncharacterized protein LOC106168241 [Lingula anatina]|eukprot:XP_013402697.1 uncharacterized protein LOC106168241 [Lingula anatina]